MTIFFAAENYSCTCGGFKLFSRQELLKIYPEASEKFLRLADSEVSR